MRQLAGKNKPTHRYPILLKVLTLNLHMGFSLFGRRFVLRELREAIRSIGADLVFLQEVLGEHRGHAERHQDWPETSQYEYLADEIWSSYAYGRNAVYESGHHGNALLSKFPIHSYENHDVSEPDAESRGLLHAVVDVPGWSQPLHAMCVHLGLTEAHRRRQLERLARFANQGVPDDAGLVVAGDFNDWRSRANGYLQSEAGLKEVFSTPGGKPARTFPSLFPLFRLDRIYVRRLLASDTDILSKKPWSRLSDHAAMVCTVAPATQ